VSDVALWEPTAIARIDSWTHVLADVASLAETVAQTDFVPETLRGNVPGITATILYGREIGLPPMQALRSVHLIKGTPALAAEAKRGLALAAGHEIRYDRADGAVCTVRGRRRGSDPDVWHTVTWTIDAANQLGLTRNPSWRNYPRAMLKARATSELCRDLFADVVGGFATVEDYDEIPAGAVPETVEDVQAPEKPTRTVGRGRRPQAPTAPPAVPSDVIPGDRLSPGSGPPVSPATPNPGDGMSTPPPGPVPPPPSPVKGETSPSGHEDYDVPLPITVPGTVIPDEPSPPLPPEPPDADIPPDGPDERASRDQGRAVFALLGKLGYADATRGERLEIGSVLAGRPVASFNDLTRGEASVMIDTLGVLAESPDGGDQLAAIVRRGI
jgi:hypothetical protein